VVGFCECDNEPSGFIKRREFFFSSSELVGLSQKPLLHGVSNNTPKQHTKKHEINELHKTPILGTGHVF
jgi:hypothetical protein